MTLSYSVGSAKSYMIAMQSMADSSLLCDYDRSKVILPEIDDETEESTKKNTELITLAQDRNEWDDLFDDFEDEVSYDVFEEKISTIRENSANDSNVFKKLFRILRNCVSSMEFDILLQNVIRTTFKYEKGELAQELLDLVGSENIELISFLLEKRQEITQHDMQQVIDLTNDIEYLGDFMTQAEMQEQMNANYEKAQNVKLDPAKKVIKYSNVYRQNDEAGASSLSFGGQKFSLPMGTTRVSLQNYEEIKIPATSKENKFKVKLLKIEDLDQYCRAVFTYETFNRIQSLVFPVAYNTNENMLICAPTGAGKTDIALITILNVIKQYSDFDDDNELNIQYDDFKIVYVAPLKALAAEIVEKFSRALSVFNIQVRELTGDMQLTKNEILSTQVIVTTPEKWDVVTRKANGDNDLVSKVKLLIIDEVHLLHEDRGSVIETLVARTLRQVESSQSMIRILGLSATLPNFMDVADFLGVNRQVGMFYFDQSFRPKPLEQQLLGCRGNSGSRQSRESIDKVSYEKMIELVKQGLQVMVFVHARKETVNTARNYIRLAQQYNETEFLAPNDSLKDYYAKEIAKNRDRDLKEIFQFGFGVHHAGMARSDRNLTEKMFKDGSIKVLCCTATLAWGVNLPADCVIIKGTQVYDSKKGGFTDLGISDVIQIFGRAGRPGFGSDHGIGILCTPNDKLDHYVSLLTEQHPIESKFGTKLADNLNAEISLGSVTNVDEAVQWLGYTYMFVRMKKNPFVYAIDWAEIAEDPQLYDRRKNMIFNAARRLHSLQMIVFDEISMHFIAKDLGRVSSDFYLLNDSIEIFNQMCSPRATEADVLSMISMSSEFDGIKFREEESAELTRLSEDSVECQVGSQLDTAPGKTNVLLQAYISQTRIFDSALNSDANYVAQNATRICRALFLIGINRRWGNFAKVMLDVCKSIEKRLWAFDHPLCQFDLPMPILKQIRSKNPSFEYLRDLEPEEIGDLVHNKGMGHKLFNIIHKFPKIDVQVEIFPITTNVMRMHAVLTPMFTWDYRIHGEVQFFWVLVEESNNLQVLHFEKYLLRRSQLSSSHEMDFMIPLSDPLPPQVVVKVVSDTWIGCESTCPVSFQHLIRPYNETLQTKLLRLKPLPVTALQNPLVESIYPFKFFNPMQTMTFHTLYNSNHNAFIGSPTGSGKTIVAELAIWHAFKTFPGMKIVYIAPMKALVRERVDDWRSKITPVTGDRVVELTGDSIPDPKEVRDATIVITTPEKFDGISRNWQTRKFVQNISLVIMDEIHLLASDRGPILEMIVSRMNYISSQTNSPIRLLGMSTAVSNAYDLASWLGVKSCGLFNFPSSVRPVPLNMYIDGFQDNLAYCPLMKTMNKPAFMSIKQHSPKKPVLIFVSSRRQTRLTALDLIHLCGMEDNPRRFLNIDDDAELQYYISKITDDTLKLSVQFGIGLHHAGLVEEDRQISHKLFQRNKLQILVATSTLAWGVNLPAHLVIIKGTQFFDKKVSGYVDMDLTDILQMMGRAGRPAYDTTGTAIVYTRENKKMFYKHFLNVGFPVESSLHKVLENHLGAEINSGVVTSKQEAIEFLRWTFFFRRAHHNPTYYGILEDTTAAGIHSYMSNLIDKSVEELERSQCVVLTGEKLEATPFLSIASYYYISHKTLRTLLDRITDKAKFVDILKWLSMAEEYNELPVRGGETIMNCEMSAQSRYPAEVVFADEEDLPIHHPKVKAFLLLQAHMSRVVLPIADYIQDTVSILDQSLRILQAFVDVASELGYFKTVLTVIKVMTCIKQGHWFDDDPVTALPGCILKKLQGVHISENGLPESEEQLNKVMNLESVGKLPYKKLHNLYQKIAMPKEEYEALNEKNDAEKIKRRFLQVCERLPLLDNIKFNPQEDNNKLILNATHRNSKHNKEFEIYCDKFPKTQKESWFCIGYKNDELFMIKRCHPTLGRDKKTTITCDFIISEELYGKEFDFLLINDAMDLKYKLSHKLID